MESLRLRNRVSLVVICVVEVLWHNHFIRWQYNNTNLTSHCTPPPSSPLPPRRHEGVCKSPHADRRCSHKVRRVISSTTHHTRSLVAPSRLAALHPETRGFSDENRVIREDVGSRNSPAAIVGPRILLSQHKRPWIQEFFLGRGTTYRKASSLDAL